MNPSVDSHVLARQAVGWAQDKKAEDVVIMDLREVLDVTDYFVVVTGTSEIQVRAIGDAVVDAAVAAGSKPLHVEGRQSGRWVLIDFVDVVVHVMLPEIRNKYKLERLWGDAPLLRFDDAGQPLQTAENREVAE